MTRQIGRYPLQAIIQPQVTDLTTIVSGLSTALTNPSTLVFNRQDQLNQDAEVTIKEMWEANETQASKAAASKTKVGLEASFKITLASDKFAVFAKTLNASITTETGQTATSITSTGTTAVVTTPLPHGYSRNDKVTIADATPSGYNGTFTVTSVPSATTFTYTVTSGLTSPATGTITVQSNDHGFMSLSDDAGLTSGSTELPYYTVVLRPYLGANPTTNPELYVIFPRVLLEGDATLKYSLSTQWGYTVMGTAFADPDTGKNKVLRGNTTLLT